MLRTFINDAKAAAGATIGKYALRASVAVPFIVAGGFATTAGTLMLVDRFGAQAAYWIMAGVFVLLGIIATVLVSAHEQEVELVVAAEKPKTDQPSGAQSAATQLPLALLGTLLTSPFGPAVAGTIAKSLVRHLPLAVLVALIGLLVFAPGQQSAETTEAGEAEGTAPEQPQASAPVAEPHREAA